MNEHNYFLTDYRFLVRDWYISPPFIYFLVAFSVTLSRDEKLVYKSLCKLTYTYFS